MNPISPARPMTGAPEPSIYYIGIYNDQKAESIQDYTLQAMS